MSRDVSLELSFEALIPAGLTGRLMTGKDRLWPLCLRWPRLSMTGPAQVASASSSVGASPTGSGVPETPLSVKSAGASPPQSSGKHLHINLGNQFRAGGSLPNVNNNVNCGNDAKEHSSPHPGAIHSIDLKVCISPDLPRTKASYSCCCLRLCCLPNSCFVAPLWSTS